MNMTRPQGSQPLSFALLGRIPDSAEPPLSDTQPDASRTDSDDRTWNWTEAATEVGINESTLRKIWWEKKLEPAFLHCPQPLRVPTRTTASGRQIAEFTTFGIEVLQAYKAALARSDRAAEVFLAEAKTKYPVPPPAAALTLTPDPTSAPEILDGELVDSESLLHALSTRRSTTQQAIDQTQQQTKALSDKNSQQLEQLQQLLAERQRQHRHTQQHQQEKWDAEVTRETLDEFLYKQQRREELLTELEQLSAMGKLTVPATSPAG